MKKTLFATMCLVFVSTFLPVQGLAQMDFGDAPEGALAYPSLGVFGAFPTCITVGPATWIMHNNFGAFFGPMVDFEGDGNAGPPCGFPPYDQDECFMDPDAGLLFPQSYTIDQTPAVVPCPPGLQAPPSLGVTCTTAVWGGNIDIHVNNFMPNLTEGFVNVLIDWNQDGDWLDTPVCPPAGTPAPEHVLVNFFPVPNGFSGPLSALGPPPFLIGPNSGYVWARITITEQPVPLPWDGSGFFEDGESEDYLLLIDPVDDPTVFPVVPTECPEIFTECPQTVTECTTGQTHCPVDPTFCPVIDTQCPADPIATICPEEVTRCPVVETECPGSETLCPDVPTWCPELQTMCPKIFTVCPDDEFTICPEMPTHCPPFPLTECPQQQTLCPLFPTECPNEPITWCPEIPTECPIDPIFTFCPLNDTMCPDAPTNCPLDWTLCPDIPTICPDIQTTCPEVPTVCPEVPTECPAQVVTECPIDPTYCPEIDTICPDVPTECPALETECPASITVCAGGNPTECQTVATECPLVSTTCPYDETNCPTGSTWCPVDPTYCPLLDSDADGVIDCYDNCTDYANGPVKGTCTLITPANIIVSTGQFCTVDGDCDPGEFCEKVQADNYPPPGNGIGDACDCEANFNCDLDVDAEDVTEFLFHFGRGAYFNPCSNAIPCSGDFLCDGDVDADDVTKFLEDFGRGQYHLPCPICPGGPWCAYP